MEVPNTKWKNLFDFYIYISYIKYVMNDTKHIKENYDTYLKLLTHYYLYCGNSLEESEKSAKEELELRLKQAAFV